MHSSKCYWRFYQTIKIKFQLKSSKNPASATYDKSFMIVVFKELLYTLSSRRARESDQLQLIHVFKEDTIYFLHFRTDRYLLSLMKANHKEVLKKRCKNELAHRDVLLGIISFQFSSLQYSKCLLFFRFNFR